MLRQFELVEAVRAYDPTADEALLNRAYVAPVLGIGLAVLMMTTPPAEPTAIDTAAPAAAEAIVASTDHQPA